MTETTFTKLAAINCSAHVEKKGQFSFLSWPWAIQTLMTHAPDATWEVLRFDGMPYLKTDCGYFVEVAVTVGGVTRSQLHPILNAQNKPIPQPSSFDINTSLARCLVKAIALHGLGLYIYAGEDLPPGAEEDGQPELTQSDLERLQELRDASLNGVDALRTAWKALGEPVRAKLKDELPALKEAAGKASTGSADDYARASNG